MSLIVLSRRVVIAAALGLGLATGPTSAQTKWNLASAYPPTNFHTENLEQFGEDVRAATNGALDITVHPNATLYKAPEIKRAVQTGQAQAGEVLISLHENEDAVYGIDVVPFLATSYEDSRKLWDASRPVIEEKLAAQGLKLLYAVPWPPQGIFAKQEIDTVEDLKGAKWRAYNVGTTRIAELVGAQPVTVQAAELPQALATGVVNAFMTSGATGVDSKVWETMTHFYDTQAWIPKNVVFVNQAAFDALDPAAQQAVLDAAAGAEERGWRISQEKTKEYLETLASNGMKVQPPSPELAEGLKKIGEQLTADWLKNAGEAGQAVIDAYRGG
jgi:TRAP-type C4-dicarboxylate transport system substrate-binding protein